MGSPGTRAPRRSSVAAPFARVSLRGRCKPGLPLTVFDDSILASAAVSAPDLMGQARHADVWIVLPRTCRSKSGASCFETFRVWVENDGSTRTVGELLFCHPNTVRYRLHRIERLPAGPCLSRRTRPNCALRWSASPSGVAAAGSGKSDAGRSMRRRCNSTVSKWI